MRSNPSDFKERCVKTEAYLRENIEDRCSNDGVARSVWNEKFFWLKSKAWWSFRNFQHWLSDYDYNLEKRSLFGDSRRGMEYIEWVRDGRHKKHRKMDGGHHVDTRGLGGEAAPREKAELGNDSQEVNDCQ